MTVIFYFHFNNGIWYWERKFHNANINQAIENYLTFKVLPFDLDISIVKWRIK